MARDLREFCARFCIPQARSLVIRARKDLLAIWAEGNARDIAGVALKLDKLIPRFDVPDARSLVRRARYDTRANRILPSNNAVK